MIYVITNFRQKRILIDINIQFKTNFKCHKCENKLTTKKPPHKHKKSVHNGQQQDIMETEKIQLGRSNQLNYFH